MTTENKVVLVTGGTSGIGLACTKKFLSVGYNVAIISRFTEKGQNVRKELLTQDNSARDRMAVFTADVRNVADCATAIDMVIKKWGRLDTLVNSAGMYVESGGDDLTAALYEAVMDTNVKGTMFMARYALPELKKTKGSIINISSDAGEKGNYFASLYCASKGAVNMFTKSLALETAKFGVRVNAVAPGDVLTPLTEGQLAAQSGSREEALAAMSAVYPIGRIGKPEEVAEAVFFLSSPAASFITGAILNIDGGLTAG